MAEDYVRPPLLGHEPRSPQAAMWRFRILLLLALAALIVGIVFGVRALIGGSNEVNPGIPTTPTSAGGSPG